MLLCPAQSGKPLCALSRNQRLEAHPDQSRLLPNSRQLTRSSQDSIIDVECCSHADMYATIVCRCQPLRHAAFFALSFFALSSPALLF